MTDNHLVNALMSAFSDMTELYNLYEERELWATANQGNTELLISCQRVFGRITDLVFARAADILADEVDWILQTEYDEALKHEEDAREMLDTLCGDVAGLLRLHELAKAGECIYAEDVRIRARQVLFDAYPKVDNLIDELDFLEILDALSE